jgi:DNA repair photolyase
MQQLAKHHINTGVAMIPIFPFITDEMIEPMIQQAKHHQAAYFLHGFLELKGYQKQTVIEIIKTRFPALVDHYDELYDHTIQPREDYIKKMTRRIQILSDQYHLPSSIPLTNHEKGHGYLDYI